MFTGIVEALGHVEDLAGTPSTGWRLDLRVPADLTGGLGRGDSVAINGVCLTIVDLGVGRLGFDLSEETLRVTALGDLGRGDPVNLERPLRLGDRLGGHLVLGHVDGVGRVRSVEPEGAGRRLTVEAPGALTGLLVPKGSVAVDGVSLTVAGFDGDAFTVALIPHTLAVTTLGGRRVGEPVNLEMDVIGKYVQALLGPYARAAGAPGVERDAEAAGLLVARHGLGEKAREA